MNLTFDPNGSSSKVLGIINADWLSFSVSLFETSTERDKHEWIFNQPPSGYKMIEFTGTNIYRRRLIVYKNDGRKIITILCSPHSRQIPRESALVEVANEWLYTGFWWVFEMLQEIHPCSFRCLTRLDVCCDFECIPQRFEIIKKLARNDAYIQGKKDGVQFNRFSYEDSRVDQVPKQLSWGSKHSNIKWKVYNKYLEIFEFDGQGHQICHKPYIAQQWESAGFDVPNVWRCEVSINPMHKFQFHDRRLTFKDAWNGFVLEDLFISLYMNRFVIRLNDGHKDKSNDKRIHLLADYGHVDRVTQWLNPTPNYREVVEYAATLNAAMKQLSKPEVIINDTMRQLWHNTVVQTVKIGRLEKYFLNTYGVTIDEYELPSLDSVVLQTS